MEFETIPTPLDLSTKEKKEATVLTDESFADLSFIRLGAGAQSIILDIQTGLHIGAEQFTSAPFSVDFDGKVIASDITITGGSISGITLSGLASGSMLNIQGWTSTMTFSATDYRTVTWTSGVITLADGTTFNIGTGNTGNMAAVTYIYFDKAVSTTALQVTTTAATAVGANKILIAVAQNNSVTTSEATLQVYGGSGGILLKADNIAAGSITANEIAANTIAANNMNVSQLSAIAADLGSITAGTVTGAIIQTASTGYRIKMNYSTNKIEYLNNDTVLASSYPSADGDHITNATDDILFAIGGTIKCGVHSGAFKPNSDKAYDLGADEAQWNNVYGTRFFAGSSGTGGLVGPSTYGFITNIDFNGRQIRAKYREFTVVGGIITAVGSESNWIGMDDMSCSAIKDCI
jgi:hypothetical protein